METYKYKGWTITIDYDQFGTNPADDGNYKIVTFGQDLITDGEALDYFAGYMGEKIKPNIQAKMRAGKIFAFSYSSHGPQCDYEILASVDKQSKYIDGFIILSDEYAKNGKDWQDRLEIAVQDLAEYTEWANGQVYCVSFVNPYGETPSDGDVAGMGDIIGYDNAVQFANQAVDTAITWDRPNYHTVKSQQLHN